MVPIVTCSLIGYIVAVGFLSVFSTAVNTLLLCLCEGRRVRARSKFIYFKREFEPFQEYIFKYIFLTIFLDCRINDGTEARPYFMPKGLMQFVASADYDLKGHQGAKGGEHQPLNVMR